MIPRTRDASRLREIEVLYESRLPDFRRFARAFLGDSELARDAVQDGFVRAIRDRDSFRGNGALEAWVWRCVVNAAKDSRRRVKTSELGETVADSPSRTDHDGWQLDPEHDDLRLLVSMLPERQRLVLFLRYFADLDHRAIACTLGIATGTVAASLHQAHASLRNALQEVPK